MADGASANGNGNANGSTSHSRSPPNLSNGKSSSNGHSNGRPNTNGFPVNGTRAHSPDSDERNTKALRALHIEVGLPVMAKKLPGGALIGREPTIELLTNVYGIEQSDDATVFSSHFAVSKNIHGKDADSKDTTRTINFSPFPKRVNDHLAILRRKLYQRIMPKFYEANKEIFGEDADSFIHDYAATLFSFKKLFKKSSNKPHEFTLNSSQLADGSTKISYNLAINDPTGEYNPAHFREVYANMDTYDASVIRFAELATSHGVAHKTDEYFMFNNKVFYYANPSAHGYPESEAPYIGYGKYIAFGAEKSVIFIEGKDKTGVPALVVDAKKSPFYRIINCGAFIIDFLQINAKSQLSDDQYNRIRPFFRNLAVHRTYGNTSAVLLIDGLVQRSAHEEYIPGKTQTIYEYFSEHYGIVLKSPRLPLARVRYPGTKVINYFPIEVLEVAENQRVRTGMQTAEDVREIIKVAAVAPYDKIEDIRRAVKALDINNDPFCKKSGTVITEEPLKVTGRLLTPPDRIFDDKPVATTVGFDSSLVNHFKKGARCEIWAAVLLNFHDGYPQSKFRSFVEKYAAECHNRGLTLPIVSDMLVVQADVNKLDKLFTDCRKAGVEFILFCHPDHDLVLHEPIKTLERKFMIITQCVRTSTMDAVIDNKMLALYNIIAKTNCKLGGYNYDMMVKTAPLDVFALYIGISLNHPGGVIGAPIGSKRSGGTGDSKSEPAYSILGYAANDGRDGRQYVGNYYVQPSHKDEMVTILDHMINEILTRFCENRGRAPSRVIVYRHGCSEGDYRKVLMYEVPVMEFFIRRLAPDAPLTVIVPTKRHNVRLFKTNINQADRAQEQNIPAGTVVDSKIVHNEFAEFYLNSHVALQGTTKAVKYTILSNSEKKLNLDLIERWTNALCYDFQIITSSTSLPAPVMVAENYAKRGRQVYNHRAMMEYTPEQIGLRPIEETRVSYDDKLYVKKSFEVNVTHRWTLRNKRYNA